MKKAIAILIVTLLFSPLTASAQALFPLVDPLPQGQVAGDSTTSTADGTGGGVHGVCDPTAVGKTGFWGNYYNLSWTSPGMGSDTYSYNTKIADANPWYLEKHFSWGRVDRELKFDDGKFLPLDEGLRGDPFSFAVHWRGTTVVPETGDYTFTIWSDDDSWLFIDGTLQVNNGGAHENRARKKTVTLSPGAHTVDIYYADRRHHRASFTLDVSPKLTFTARQPGCDDLYDGTVTPTDNGGGGNGTGGPPPTTNGNGNGGNGGGTAATQPTGQVLGATTTPYTPAVRLIKTATSPAVYAVFANGYRHYITNPTAFARYGYKWTDIETVSQRELDRYPDVRLVRTPEDATIYFIYTRVDRQWLKTAIPTPTAFVSYPQNEWGNLVVIDHLDRDAYPNAELVSTDSGQTVYLLQNGERRKFRSIDVLVNLGYSPSEIVGVSSAHLNSYELGEPVG